MKQPTVFLNGEAFKVVSIFFKEDGSVWQVRTNNFETLTNHSEGEFVKWFNSDGVKKEVRFEEEMAAAGTATQEIETAIQTLSEAKLNGKASMARMKLLRVIRKLMEEQV